MYNVKIVYVDGTKEEIKCEDFSYDEMGDLVTFELDIEGREKMDVMIHQIRKIHIIDENIK